MESTFIAAPAHAILPYRLRGSAPAMRPPAIEHAPAAGVLMQALDHLDYGVMLVDDTAQVRFANRAARRECDASKALRLSDGCLHLERERDKQGLMRALATARSGRRSLLTLVASSEPMLTLAVVPVHEDNVSLVVFGRRQVCEPLSVEFFAREHRLTSAEGGVLRGLAQGLRPAQIARSAGVAISTVRTQIASIRAKTGARSIGELVRLVTVLPPIVPLLATSCG